MPYFQDLNVGLHFLSAQDVLNGWQAKLPAGTIAITDQQAIAIQNAPPTSTQLHALLVESAKASLDVSDRVCLRCYKANVTFPAAWQAWTVSLRNIVNGTDTNSTSLPTQPAYPAGT